MLNKPKIKDLLTKAEALLSELESLQGDMQAEWDVRSERWQESEKGQDAQSEIDILEEATDSVRDATVSLEDLL